MRDTLVWSYSAAGFMNTINAAGYLVGALLASRMIRRFGLAASVRWGTLACVLSLALCAISGNFFVLSFARLLAGFGAAAGFVGGGALAATIAQSRPERANFLLSLFYAGPGIGILASGLIAPFVLAGVRAGLVVDRMVGADAARGRHDRSRCCWRRSMPTAIAAARRRPHSRSRRCCSISPAISCSAPATSPT